MGILLSLQGFIDQGALHVDMLPAWQPHHSRDLNADKALEVPR